MCNMKKKGKAIQQQESRLPVKSTGEDRCPLPDLAVLIDVVTICTACRRAVSGKRHPAALPAPPKVRVTSNPLQAPQLGLLKAPLGLFKIVFLNKADYLKKGRSAPSYLLLALVWRISGSFCKINILTLPQMLNDTSLSHIALCNFGFSVYLIVPF